MNVSYEEVRRRCLKPDEHLKPVYAVKVTHWFSTRLVWLCQDFDFGPDLVTLGSLIFGLIGVVLLAAFTPGSMLLGALFIELYYVFDAFDGQWARFKNKKSLTGAFFDYFINYALQPPLCFAIGWGAFLQTGEPFYVMLGFLAGFSTLWVVLIWNLRATIVLNVLKHRGAAPKAASPDSAPASAAEPSIPKKLFSLVHKTMVFPWFMNVLTAVAALAFIAGKTFPFGYFLVYYGFAGPLFAVTLTAWWLVTKKIDKAPELA